MNDPILVTGCARSGTSMTAGIIDRCGAFGGKMSPPNSNNKKGMFENQDIRNKITKPYLRKLGVDQLGQWPLPDINNLKPEPGWKDKVEFVMKRDGYKGGPWFYKGAKMCLFWPIWNTAFPNAKWIIVRRRDDDIIHSCLKTHFMRAFREAAGWQKWIDVHKVRFKEMLEGDLDVIEYWPEDIIERNDFSSIKFVIEQHCELEYKEDAIKDFIEPKLWKSR